jgi:cell division transport system permease protein
MVTLWRIMVAGARNFLRNAWLSTAATAVMTVTLVLVLVSFVASRALSGTIRTVEDRVHVSIYLKDSTTPELSKELQKKLETHENVRSIRYVSKSDALAAYREQYKGNPKLLEAVTETDNPLPASLEVKAKDLRQLDPIVELVRNSEDDRLVLEYSYQAERKNTIDKVIRASNFIKTAGLVASGLFVVISILIIFNTIRMAIFTRKNEIEIMKLVGATNSFIRGPFLFEAALYGMIAAVIAVLIGYGLVVGGGPRLPSDIQIAPTIELFKNQPALILAGELVIGICIGVLSSLLAMVRYLKL